MTASWVIETDPFFGWDRTGNDFAFDVAIVCWNIRTYAPRPLLVATIPPRSRLRHRGPKTFATAAAQSNPAVS